MSFSTGNKSVRAGNDAHAESHKRGGYISSPKSWKELKPPAAGPAPGAKQRPATVQPKKPR